MATRKELTVVASERYLIANHGEKTRILDEFADMTGYHRKHPHAVSASSTHPSTGRAPHSLTLCKNRQQATEHDPSDPLVACLSEMDDVEIEIVVPQSVDAFGHINQRNALFPTEQVNHAVVGGVGGDDVVDRLEHGAVELLDLARAVLVDRHG